MYKHFKCWTALTIGFILAACMGFPVCALNPATGDSSGSMIVVMGGLLAVSLVLIIIFAVISAKKKKK